MRGQELSIKQICCDLSTQIVRKSLFKLSLHKYYYNVTIIDLPEHNVLLLRTYPPTANQELFKK